jgi:hypothetical protein
MPEYQFPAIAGLSQRRAVFRHGHGRRTRPHSTPWQQRRRAERRRVDQQRTAEVDGGGHHATHSHSLRPVPSGLTCSVVKGPGHSGPRSAVDHHGRTRRLERRCHHRSTHEQQERDRQRRAGPSAPWRTHRRCGLRPIPIISVHGRRVLVIHWCWWARDSCVSEAGHWRIRGTSNIAPAERSDPADRIYARPWNFPGVLSV